MRSLRWILFAVSLLALGACGGSGNQGVGATYARGALQNYSLVSDHGWLYYSSVLTYAGVDLSAEVGVSFYKITYTTIDINGRTTTASGAVAIPDGKNNLGLVGYQHSTATLRTNVPSTQNDESTFIAAAFASSGKYVVAMADYLGLGDNPGLHPYMQASSEASASVDAMRAARQLCQKLNVTLNGQVFLAGYSQGGHSTMAVSQVVQNSLGTEFPITASAPMSGPYDLSSTQAHFAIDDPGQDTNVFLAYITLAYNMTYGLYTSPSEAFLSPYDTQVPTLFDGTKDITAVQQALPNGIKTLFQPTFIAGFTKAGSKIQTDLKQNDLWNWKPMMPMRIYAARSDEIVAFANAEKAYDQFLDNGSPNVALVDLGGNLSHVDGIEPAVQDARHWFDTLLTVDE